MSPAARMIASSMRLSVYLRAPFEIWEGMQPLKRPIACSALLIL